MPEIPFVDPAKCIDPADLFSVGGVMAYPDDERAHRQYIAVHLAAYSALPGPFGEKIREYLAVAPISLDWIARLPSLDEVTQAAKRRSDAAGGIAGLLLNTVLAAAESHPELATIKKARHVLRAGLGDAKYRERHGDATIASDRGITAAWARFMPVSPFWGAAQIYGAIAPDSRAFDLEDRWLTMPDFLALAEDLRSRGEAFTPPGSHAPLLDPTATWRVPSALDLPDTPAAVTGLKNQALELIATYKHA